MNRFNSKCATKLSLNIPRHLKSVVMLLLPC